MQQSNDINILLSLPQGAARQFNDIMKRWNLRNRCFAGSDPADRRIGSGSGTLWLLDMFRERNGNGGRSILIHAGGQSRRLPAYAASGKILTPIPAMRWDIGQYVNQTLLDLQIPLYSRMLEKAPTSLTTLVASGDVLLDITDELPQLPEADVVCLGFWADTAVAQRHGVFCIPRDNPSSLAFMLQKPSASELGTISATHFYLVDSGVWLLSERALDTLRLNATDADGNLGFYDLYGSFGTGLGSNPSNSIRHIDPENPLTVAIVPLTHAGFRHFGTTRELISSTLALQNKVADQRLLTSIQTRPNPALFVQNCELRTPLTEANNNVWVENSIVGKSWTLTSENVITGVPDNDWQLRLDPGQCIDIVPTGDGSDYAVRPYGFDDPMSGSPEQAMFIGQPLAEWAAERGLTIENISGGECVTDIQHLPLFAMLSDTDSMGLVARWMLSEPQLTEGREIWLRAQRLSANEIMDRANLVRLLAQRSRFLAQALPVMEKNRHKSVFYQLDLSHTAELYSDFKLSMPEPLSTNQAPLFTSIRNHMFRSRLCDNDGNRTLADAESAEAFRIMRSGLIESISADDARPTRSALPDQIVWARSPVRIDVAGGWTDTPPYSMACGGSVINLAIELNGQPPLQVFIKASDTPHIILRSIDMGASETVTTYEELSDFTRVGSPFAIPKAALSLAGFLPQFGSHSYRSLQQQLTDFGCGIEVTLLSAIPAGSGLGTSSILSATTLAAINDFCSLGWTSSDICSKVLILEQMLTTGGGWQDQYGGVVPGVKLLTTKPSLRQQPSIAWLPDSIWTDPEMAPCHLLYYTGITRTAKGILQQIVRNMFLNNRPTLDILDRMQCHTSHMAEAIQQRDFGRYGQLVKESWCQNIALDCSTNPVSVARITEMVDDLCLGYKLPGAGGGGYLYMVAKDPEAALRIRKILTSSQPNAGARFVNMTLSTTGLQVSRS